MLEMDEAMKAKLSHRVRAEMFGQLSKQCRTANKTLDQVSGMRKTISEWAESWAPEIE